LTIHPRTAQQGFSGVADWDVIGRIRAVVAIPVIGNGDIRRPEQVERMRHLTGCDGVMIGRAAMGNPWIFQQAKQLAAGEPPRRPSPGERLDVMLEHLRLFQECPPSRPLLTRARSLIIWYSRGFPGSTRFRAALAGCGTSTGMLEISRNFFAALGETSPQAEGEEMHEG
jgi:tRNA-dihydrouridine synthase